jgi:polysaccharide biosynthesis/export protein
MKHSNPSIIKVLLWFMGIALVLSSCVPQKKILYLQKANEEDTITNYKVNKDYIYHIQPKDNLYIKIGSLDEKSYQFFNRQGIASGYDNYTNDASIYLSSYSVDDQGDVELAILGKIHVKDLTVEEAGKMIQGRVDEYLKETIVIVKLVNYNVTILGEVLHPGEFKIYQDKINIFEVLSLAGDMTEFANRNAVSLIRKTDTGAKIHQLDLTSASILSSKYFYIMPNDVIIVSPLDIKRWGFTQFPYTVLLTGVTVLISILLLIYTVKI